MSTENKNGLWNRFGKIVSTGSLVVFVTFLNYGCSSVSVPKSQESAPTEQKAISNTEPEPEAIIPSHTFKISTMNKSVIAEARKKPYITVKVFYGTNRKRADGKINYNSQRVKKINYGTANVTIPKIHQIGEVEKPKWYKFEFDENPDKHVTIQKISPLNADDFFQDAKDDIRNDSNQTLVFIHGYNVKFNQALERTAQIAYDLKFKGIPITFSWPSKGTLAGYSSDEETVRLTTKYLKQFLIDIKNKIGSKKFHIIAHSMGNRILVNALKDLDKKLDINQIILASPDINSEIFKEDIAPKIIDKAKKITIYVSDFDKALLASKKIHKYPRVGLSSDGIIKIQGMDVINASNIKSDFMGHSFFMDTQEVLNDMFNIIRNGYNPSNRPLEKSNHYWIFKK